MPNRLLHLPLTERVSANLTVVGPVRTLLSLLSPLQLRKRQKNVDQL